MPVISVLSGIALPVTLQKALRIFANILCVGCALDNIAGPNGPVVARYNFKGDRPRFGPCLEAELGAQVCFNMPEDSFTVRRDDLEAPPPYSHEGMNAHFVDLLQKELASVQFNNDPVVQLREFLASTKDLSNVSLELLSDALKTSSRTLHRRLVASNTTYSAELDNARKTRALTLVTTTNESLVNIGYSLGFSSPGAFTRAFKRWYNAAPMQVRKKALRA